jgi:membrane protein
MPDAANKGESSRISGLILAIAAGIVLGKMTRPVARSATDSDGSQASFPPLPVGHPTALNPHPGPVSHRPGIVGILWSIVDRLGRDNVSMVAAGVAFYTLLAIFPALAAIVSLYGLFGDPADVSRQLAPFAEILPREALTLINDGLQSFVSKKDAHFNIALVTGILLALWSARAGMSAVMIGLNIAYDEIERRSIVVQYLVAIGMTAAAVFLAIIIVFGIGIIPVAMALLQVPPQLATIVALVRWRILAIVILIGFALLYRFAPCRQNARWRWIAVGSATATVLWLGGSWLFSYYVGHFGRYDATYGSLGAVVVLLLWFWVAALVFLLGAEVDAELHARASATGSPTGRLPTSQ